MNLQPDNRPDWYVWTDADRVWSEQYADLPGLKFDFIKGVFSVTYHISHVPCMPDAVRTEHAVVERARCQSYTLPFERSGLLRPYQMADLQRMKTRKGILLAHEMRLGKTAVACHLHDPNDGILLVAGPLSAREAWRDWIERVTGTPPFLLYGRKDAAPAPGYKAYFCHYDVLEAHTGFLTTQRIGTFVLDELHLLAAARTQRANAVNACAFQAKKILGLTGTPVWNRPKSLYHILHLLTPGAWGNRFSFMCRWADAQPGAHGWNYDGASNTDELSARLKTIMVRRTWQEVMPDLPPTTRVIEPVEVTGSAYAALEAAAMHATLARGTPNEAGYLATLRRKLAEVKIKPSVQIAERAGLDGHKVVLWVWHNEIGDKVEAALRNAMPNASVLRLCAADSAPRREAIVQDFRAFAVPAFLVVSMGVGGTALDLSCADYAIFVELDWTPAVVSQAEFRTFHKDRPHVVVYLHADDPVESKLIEALDVKNSFAAALGLGADEIAKKVL